MGCNHQIGDSECEHHHTYLEFLLAVSYNWLQYQTPFFRPDCIFHHSDQKVYFRTKNQYSNFHPICHENSNVWKKAKINLKWKLIGDILGDFQTLWSIDSKEGGCIPLKKSKIPHSVLKSFVNVYLLYTWFSCHSLLNKSWRAELCNECFGALAKWLIGWFMSYYFL